MKEVQDPRKTQEEDDLEENTQKPKGNNKTLICKGKFLNFS